MVQLLLGYGANPNVKDRDGWTSLHVAALKQHTGLVQLLLDRVDDGNIILDWAVLQRQDNKKQALLEEAAEKKAVVNTALTGLRETVQERQVGRSQVLLDKGADVNGKDIGGSTALMIAVFWGYEELMQLLLDNGADVNICWYNRDQRDHMISGG
jgi:ankyrin repeat protein